MTSSRGCDARTVTLRPRCQTAVISLSSEWKQAHWISPETQSLWESSRPICQRPYTHVCDHNSGSASTLRGYLQKFIGEPRLQRTKRKVPAVNVVSKLPIAFRGNGPAATFRVCSGGEGLLVWVSVSSGNQTPIQLVDMSKLEVVSQHQAIKHKDNAVLSLVNVDENSAIATSGHSHIHRLFRERGDSEHLPSTQQISIFAKARLRACVAERSPNESTILPSVSNSQRLTDGTPPGLSPTDQFTISRASRPVSMDISSSGHIFAVVDRLHKLHLYRRGATNPFSTFPSQKSEQKGVKVADVCSTSSVSVR